MARTPITGGNWKMHTTLAEATALAQDVRNRLGAQRLGEVVLFAPFPFLAQVADKVAGSQVTVGAQDLYFEAKGAFTGAVSAAMIVSTGATHVLIGHSERRWVFGDTDAIVAKKLGAALAAGLIPVLCVGEQLAERQNGTTFAVIETRSGRGPVSCPYLMAFSNKGCTRAEGTSVSSASASASRLQSRSSLYRTFSTRR